MYKRQKYGPLPSYKPSTFHNPLKKKKSCKSQAKRKPNAPSFIYIPESPAGRPELLSPSNYLQTWSNVLKKKRTLSGTTSTETNFNQIYRKSGVVDKKLFLSTGFIAEDIYSPTESPSLLTPITPAIPTTVIDSTFPYSYNTPNPLRTDFQLLPTPGFTSAYHAARYNTHHSTKRPGNLRNPHSTTQDTGVTTYISQDREIWEPNNNKPCYFDFDEDAVKNVHRFYASSLKTEVLGTF